MVFHATRCVHLGGVQLKPAFGRAALHKGGATHVGDLLHGLFGGQAVGDLDDGALGIAVQQQVALGIHHHAAADLVAPVVVVRDAAQAAFDAAQDDGHIFECFTAALAVDHGGAVWALAAYITWCVSVVAADFAIRRVAVDHGIHVARRHAEEQIGFAQRFERIGALPIRLSDDAHAKALRLQRAANHRHAKAGVVHIGVARDDDDVAAVPAQRIHLRLAHGQEFGRAKSGRPVLTVTGQRFGWARKMGHVWVDAWSAGHGGAGLRSVVWGAQILRAQAETAAFIRQHPEMPLQFVQPRSRFEETRPPSLAQSACHDRL